MVRLLLVIFAGAIVGCLAGILAPVVFVAACVWDERTTWSALAAPQTVPHIVVLVALSTLNGAVGAWDGWRSNVCRAWPVALAPLLLFIFPATEIARYPSSSKAWGPAMLIVAVVAPFVWVAGRVGQEMGVRAARTRRTNG
jgi:hypothetical protein